MPAWDSIAPVTRCNVRETHGTTRFKAGRILALACLPMTGAVAAERLVVPPLPPARPADLTARPGEVPLPKLQNTLMRKPRALKKDQVNALDRRLKALGGVAMPLPKGPIPRNVPRSGKMR